MTEAAKPKRMTKANGKAKAAPKPAFVRPRGGDARAISDLLPDIGRAAFRRFGFVQSSVVSRWREIVGGTYADVCVPEAIRFPRGERAGGTLELVVTGAFAPQLQAVQGEIIERVNRFFGYAAVAKIRMRHGVVTPVQPSQARQAPPALRPVSVELGDSLRAIVDPELSAVLESLAAAVDAKDAPKQTSAQAPQDDPFARLFPTGVPKIC